MERRSSHEPPGLCLCRACAHDCSASLSLPSLATPASRQRTGRPHLDTLQMGRLAPLRSVLREVNQAGLHGEGWIEVPVWLDLPCFSTLSSPPHPGASPVPADRGRSTHCSLPTPPSPESPLDHSPLTNATISPFPELNFITQSPEPARHGPHLPSPDAFHLTRRRGGVSWRWGLLELEVGNDWEESMGREWGWGGEGGALMESPLSRKAEFDSCYFPSAPPLRWGHMNYLGSII